MPIQRDGASLAVRTLERMGVEYLFTLSGNQIMSIFDAAIDSSIELIHVRHEAAAVHTADAWGRLRGQPGVALLTAGPGLTNALTAMYVALMSESPVVVISGHARTDQLGRGAFQEMNQAAIAGHVCKASWSVKDARHFGKELARAFRLASSGRPGPVHISIPNDLLECSIPGYQGLVPDSDEGNPIISLLDRKTADEILAAAHTAHKPLIIGGPCLAGETGRALLEHVSQGTGIPAVLMASPRGINDPHLGAFAEVLIEADFVILIGKKIDFTLGFGSDSVLKPEANVIQIDPDAAVLDHTKHVFEGTGRLRKCVIADPLPTLEQLIQAAEQFEPMHQEWLAAVDAAVSYRPPEWETINTPDGPVHAVEVLLPFAKRMCESDQDVVFISDGGEFGQWAQACLDATYRIINGPSGSIGSAIPFALAARLAFPNAKVVTCLGDGTIGFHGFEFDTAVRYGIPFVAVVGHDACWNAEYQIQRNRFGEDRLIACELADTRYDETVNSLGGTGLFVDGKSQLDAALAAAWESTTPTCIIAKIQRVAAPVIRRSC